MKEFFESTIFKIGTYELKVYTLIGLLVFLFIMFIIQFTLRKLIYRSNSIDPAKKFAFNKLTYYILSVISVISGMMILGFDMSVMVAGSAALLVGIGFGLQGLFSDFISGVILLLDGTLKVGDIIEVDSMVCKVIDINFRTTTVLGREENYVILPNSFLTGNKVINWTYSKVSSRFKVSVNVDYGTDVPKLMELLKETVKKNSAVLQDPEPFVRFEAYGESSLNFAVYYFSNEIFRSDGIKSDMRVEIFKNLRENNIKIPFPQVVIHKEN